MAEVRRSNMGIATELAVVRVQLDHVESQLTNLDRDLRGSYVTQDQFRPVRNIVYGALSFAMLGLLGAVGSALVYFLRATPQ